MLSIFCHLTRSRQLHATFYSLCRSLCLRFWFILLFSFFFFSFPQCVVPSILWSPCVLHAIDDLNLVRVFCAHGIAFCLDGGCCLPMNNDTHTKVLDFLIAFAILFAPFFSFSSSVHHFYCGKYVKFRHRFSSFSHAHWKLVFTANECVHLARTHILFSHPLCVCTRTRFLLNWHHHHSILVISFSGLFIYGLPSTTIFNVIQAFNRRISLTHSYSVFFSLDSFWPFISNFVHISLYNLDSTYRNTIVHPQNEKKRWINTNWISRLYASLSIDLLRSLSHILSRTNSKKTTKSTQRSIDKHYNNYFDGNEMNITLDMLEEKKEPSNANDTEHVTHRENIRKEKEKYHHQKIKIHTLIEAEEKNARKYLGMTHGNGSITISSWLSIFCFYVCMNFLLLCYSTATKTSTAILLTWITEKTENKKMNKNRSIWNTSLRTSKVPIATLHMSSNIESNSI